MVDGWIIWSSAKACARDKKQTHPLSHWDSLLCNAWHKKIYMYPLQYHKKKKLHKRLSEVKKKADLASVSLDGEQAHWVNGLQCARLLFLRCITATAQADELATPPGCANVTPQRFPLSLCRSLSLLFHYVMLRQATRVTPARLACALNANTVCSKELSCQRTHVTVRFLAESADEGA